MDESGKIEFLDRLISNKLLETKWNLVEALGAFLVGAIISTVIYFISLSPPLPDGSPNTDNIKALSNYLLAIPPLVGTFLSGPRIKDYFSKRTNIASYKQLQKAYTSPPVPEKIEEWFEIVFRESLGRN